MSKLESFRRATEDLEELNKRLQKARGALEQLTETIMEEFDIESLEEAEELLEELDDEAKEKEDEFKQLYADWEEEYGDLLSQDED